MGLMNSLVSSWDYKLFVVGKYSGREFGFMTGTLTIGHIFFFLELFKRYASENFHLPHTDIPMGDFPPTR